MTVTCFSTPLCPYCWSIDISGGSDKGRRRVSLFCQLFTNINTYKECLHQQLPVLGGPHHYLLCKHILPHSETCSLLDLKINNNFFLILCMLKWHLPSKYKRHLFAKSLKTLFVFFNCLCFVTLTNKLFIDSIKVKGIEQFTCLSTFFSWSDKPVTD